MWSFEQGATEAYFLYAAGAAAGRSAAMAGISTVVVENHPDPRAP